MKQAFMESLKKRIEGRKPRILYPEPTDPRILQAAKELSEEGIVEVFLIGDRRAIESANSVGLNLNQVQIRDPAHDTNTQRYAEHLFELRKEKGLTKEEAQFQIQNPITFAMVMCAKGNGEGVVSGSMSATSETVRPALQIIKTHREHECVSGMFIMLHRDEIFLFADCAVTPSPTAEQLVDIAQSSALSAMALGKIPQIAMLSFSTKGSAKDPAVEKVRKATELFKEKFPEYCIDGEIQVDAALDPLIAEKKIGKAPFSPHANVLIFPDLNSGNIGYKLVQRLAGDLAVGPILQGLNKPVNDLSRGCSVEEIKDVSIITAVQSIGEEHEN